MRINWEDTLTFKYLLLSYDPGKGFWSPDADHFVNLIAADLLAQGLVVYSANRRIESGDNTPTGIDYIDRLADTWRRSWDEYSRSHKKYSKSKGGDLYDFIKFANDEFSRPLKFWDFGRLVRFWDEQRSKFQAYSGLTVTARTGLLRREIFAFSDQKWLEQRRRLFEQLKNIRPVSDCTADALLLTEFAGQSPGELRELAKNRLSACKESLPLIRDYCVAKSWIKADREVPNFSGG